MSNEIPALYKDAVFSDCLNLHGYGVVDAMNWFNDFNGTLLVTGGVGSGKTYLAFSLIKGLLESGKIKKGEFLYTSPFDIMNEHGKYSLSYENGHESKKYFKTPLLFIDNFDLKYEPYYTSPIFYIIKEREKEKLPTIFCSIASLSDIFSWDLNNTRFLSQARLVELKLSDLRQPIDNFMEEKNSELAEQDHLDSKNEIVRFTLTLTKDIADMIDNDKKKTFSTRHRWVIDAILKKLGIQ